MTPPTVSPLTDLQAALTAVDDAVGACLALAWATGIAPDDRRRAAQRTVGAYETADRRADLLLAAIVEAGGASGLLGAVEAACHRAGERVTHVYALRAGMDDKRPGDRAATIAEHAYERALARDQYVRDRIVTPWWQRRGEAA